MKIKMYASPILKPGLALSVGDIVIAKVLGGDDAYYHITDDKRGEITMEEIDPEGELVVKVSVPMTQEVQVFGEVVSWITN